MAPARHSAFLCFPILFSILVNPNPVVSQPRPVFACDVSADPGLKTLTFCDPTLAVKTRVDDLVGRLTLPEKIGWLVHSAKGVARLGIPSYQWWSEALHGVSYVGPGTKFTTLVPGATSFPQVILTAATFNESLFQTIGKVVSTEARAMYNVGLAGLTFWSPNINVFRDPRWGRGQETPGEDPLLVSKYGAAYVRGLQETDDGNKEKLKVAACCKHYTAYDLDNWKGIQRYNFNAVVTQQDMDDTFQPPFKSCVIDGNVASVMCSYNQVNGKPTCGDPDLLAGVIRGQWKLNGYIVTDCDSLNEIFYTQKYTKTPEETVALALNSGLDLNCGDFLTKFTQTAVDANLINDTTINRAISNNFATMMRLGFFDGDPKTQPYGNLGPNDVCTSENQELAREVARQGIVLLKNNKENALPLSTKTIKSLAVIGPNANATHTMLANYEGSPCKYTTPLQGLSSYVPTVYNPGCSDVSCGVLLDSAVQTAAAADAVVLIMGSDQSIEGESRDRLDITLPGQQQLLVSKVANVSKGPVILVIMSGGGMDVQFAKDDPKISTILWVGFPGEAGGGAIADVVFGSYNPSGRLPMTWYPQSYVEKVEMTNMNMRADVGSGYPGRTYRFYKGETVFSFGDGMSYTEFKHELVSAPKVVRLRLGVGHVCRLETCESIDAEEEGGCGEEAVEVSLRVRNVGKMRGRHTVLLLSSPPRLHNAAEKQLVGFRKVDLGAETEVVVGFRLDVCRDLGVVDEEGRKRVVLGEHVIHVGDLKHSFNLRV